MQGKILYLGTDPSRYTSLSELIHLPLIQICPLPIPPKIRDEFAHFTHVILTSPNAARILMGQMPLDQKQVVVIGKGTAAILQSQGFRVHSIARVESQEGLIELLKNLSLKGAYLFYPRSSKARPLLANYLQDRGLKHCMCDLYETRFLRPSHTPSLEEVKEIIFTSPSTVHAFIALYGALPKDKKLTCIGPITLAALQSIDR